MIGRRRVTTPYQSTSLVAKLLHEVISPGCAFHRSWPVAWALAPSIRMRDAAAAAAALRRKAPRPKNFFVVMVEYVSRR